MAFEPVRINTKQEAAPVEVEPLFYIDEERFDIPVKVPPVMSVRFLRHLRSGNTEQAVALAFDDLLGKKALDRLAKCDQLEPGQLTQIMKIIQDKMMAAQEEMLGN